VRSLKESPLKVHPALPALWMARKLQEEDGAYASARLPRWESRTADHDRQGPGCSPGQNPSLLGWEWTATADCTVLLVGSYLNSLTLTVMRETRRLDLLVPVRDNDGRPFLEEDFTAVEHLLVDVVGGFTRRPDVTGVWRNDSGRIFHDTSRSYTATVPVAQTTEVASILHRFIADRFRQEAVMLEATPTLSAVF